MQTHQTTKTCRKGTAMYLGAGIGAAFGAEVGIAIQDVAQGLAIGVVLGVAVGAAVTFAQTQKYLEGIWRWAVFFAIFYASSRSGRFLSRLFDAPSAYPGSDPPWYYIRRDFFQGLGNLAGMLCILGLIAATWRRYISTNWMFLLALLSMLPDIVTAISIYVRCAHFFDYSHAVSAWPTFNAYLRSKAKLTGIIFGFEFVLLLGTMIWKDFVKRKTWPSRAPEPK